MTLAARRTPPAVAFVDPRIGRSKEVVLRAALSLLGEVGYGAFTIEGVAARSGVAKSTIYRHWRDRVALIADAFLTFHAQEGPDLRIGTPRERVVRIVRHVAEVVAGSTFSTCVPALIDGAERDASLRGFHHRFQAEARKPLVAVIQEGIDGGHCPSYTNAELAAVALLGAVFYRRLMSPKPFTPDDAEALVATVLGPGRRPRVR